MPSRQQLIRSVLLFALLAAMLTLPAASAAKVEPYPDYRAQRTCSPEAKKGTLVLARYLQAAYPGTGSYGISRSCGSGGVSEHKEGRAFDWRVDVTQPRQRRQAQHFVRRLLAEDKAGNDAALARRLGVMYFIWNDHIYSASTRYSKRPYQHASCSSRQSCSPTLRHRDHVHLSLSWGSARSQTSWYSTKQGRAAANGRTRAVLPAQQKPKPKPKKCTKEQAKKTPKKCGKPKPKKCTKEQAKKTPKKCGKQPKPEPTPEPEPNPEPDHDNLDLIRFLLLVPSDLIDGLLLALLDPIVTAGAANDRRDSEDLHDGHGHG